MTDRHKPLPSAIGRSNPLSSWLTLRRFAVVLGILIFAQFPDILLGTRTFVFRDFGIFGYPLAHYHREAFWRGEIPFINPLNDFGLPFLAQWNTLTLYPGSLVYLLLPLSWSLGLFCVLHLFLAGLGMFMLAHEWTRNGLAGTCAGVAFTFSGLTLGCLMWPNNIAALAWMPWVVWATQRAWLKGGTPPILAAGAIGALQMLTGAPEILLQTWLFLALLWALSARQQSTSLRSLIVRPALVIGIVLGLASVQLLPFLDLVANSHRDGLFDNGRWSMPGTGFANLLVPLFQSFRFPGGVYYQYDQQWISSYYPGIGMLALALVAVARVRQREGWLLFAVLFLSLTMALGAHGPLYSKLKQLVPGLGWIRFPVKFVVLGLFVVPLLGALGLAAIVGRPNQRSDVIVVVWVLLCAGIAAILWFAQAHPTFALNDLEWTALLKNGATRAVLLTASLALSYGLTRVSTARHRALLGAALVTTLWIDGVTHAPGQNPTIGRNAYADDAISMPAKPVAGYARAMISPAANENLYHHLREDLFEAHCLHRLALMANCNLLDEVPKADGFFSLYIATERPVRLLLYPPNNIVPERLADFLAITHITAPGTLTEWQRRTNALPVVTAGQQPIFAADTAVLEGVTRTTFDPRRVVYLPPEAAREIDIARPTSASILNVHATSHRWQISVLAHEKSLVVISQAHHHGWEALIDGQPTPIWRANHGFQAIVTPAGRHEIEIVYHDKPFAAGAALSGLTGLALSAVWIRDRRRSRPPTSDL